MFLKQSTTGSRRPATVLESLAGFVAALICSLAARLARLSAPATREARASTGAAEMPPCEPLPGSARPLAGYDGYSKATVWSACAGPYARDVATGALVGGATVGANDPVAAVVANDPTTTPSGGGF
jgi:hypothetical protein